MTFLDITFKILSFLETDDKKNSKPTKWCVDCLLKMVVNVVILLLLLVFKTSMHFRAKVTLSISETWNFLFVKNKKNMSSRWSPSYRSRKPPEWKGMRYKSKSKKTNILANIWTCGIYSVLASLFFHLLFNTFLIMSRMVWGRDLYLHAYWVVDLYYSKNLNSNFKFISVKIIAIWRVNCATDICRNKMV